jgi:hypothetical protein
MHRQEFAPLLLLSTFWFLSFAQKNSIDCLLLTSTLWQAQNKAPFSSRPKSLVLLFYV